MYIYTLILLLLTNFLHITGQQHSLTIPLQFSYDRQKTTVKFVSPTSVAILRFLSIDPVPDDGNGKWGSPTTHKQINIFDFAKQPLLTIGAPQHYNILDEINDKQKYVGMPTYVDECPVYKGLIPWHNQSQLEHHIGSFGTNSYYHLDYWITYPWGGIELHDGDCTSFYSIHNSISAIDIKPSGIVLRNSLIALGSYDGTIYIVKTSTYNTDNMPVGKTFSQFFTDNKFKTKPTSIQAQHNHFSTTPITHIKWLSDSYLVYSTEDSLCGIIIEHDNATSNMTLKKDFSEDVDNIRGLTTCNEDIVFSILNGIAILKKNERSMSLLIPDKEIINSSINVLAAFRKDQDNTLYIFIGTQDGHLSLWKNSDDSPQELSYITSIKHNDPIYSIEINAMQTHILVKTTETHQGTDAPIAQHIDHAHVYLINHLLNKSVDKPAEGPKSLMLSFAPLLERCKSIKDMLDEATRLCYLYNGTPDDKTNITLIKKTLGDIITYDDFNDVLKLMFK